MWVLSYSVWCCVLSQRTEFPRVCSKQSCDQVSASGPRVVNNDNRMFECLHSSATTCFFQTYHATVSVAVKPLGHPHFPDSCFNNENHTSPTICQVPHCSVFTKVLKYLEPILIINSKEYNKYYIIYIM